ncbi:Apoa1bpp [Cyanidiococcus yangmingshanensis]|uniref:NAD(P)H-hydrate epimerase n=1 Tax=Cyanidiococcus yangmingshanensis TaxID=2690220 RepID=A0A7J7IJG8_9RHOD|nr:Apoa1bpp [Cyanidiococcus yangmingshanensis]
MSDAYGYTLEQLMELAGLAVALATARECPNRCENVVAVCGPGNNGGDGLVAARHLRLFGYEHVQAIYPRPGGSNHFQRLVKQAQVHGVQFVDQAAFGRTIQDADVLIDAIFGFSFRAERPIREPYASLIRHMNESSRAHTVIAVDVPSGWDVEHGPPPAAQTSDECRRLFSHHDGGSPMGCQKRIQLFGRMCGYP